MQGRHLTNVGVLDYKSQYPYIMSTGQLEWGTAKDILSPCIRDLMSERDKVGRQTPVGQRYKLMANAIFGQLGSEHTIWGGLGRNLHEQTARIGREIIQADEELLQMTQKWPPFPTFSWRKT